MRGNRSEKDYAGFARSFGCGAVEAGRSCGAVHAAVLGQHAHSFWPAAAGMRRQIGLVDAGRSL